MLEKICLYMCVYLLIYSENLCLVEYSYHRTTVWDTLLQLYYGYSLTMIAIVAIIERIFEKNDFIL